MSYFTCTCVVSCLVCYLLPWIILDFHFANGDSECLNQEITKFNIPFDLQKWLHVDAITMLICGVVGCCAGCCMCLFGLFTFAWHIVGALMFWGDLYQTGTCNSDLTVYMWVNLIMGFVSCCCVCGGGSVSLWASCGDGYTNVP